MTDIELLKYCRCTYNSDSFTGNSVITSIQGSNIIHTQLRRCLKKKLLNSFIKEGYIYYFFEE